MKTKFYFLLGAILAVSLSVRASQITNSVNITTNLLFCLSSEKNGLFPYAQFKSDEVVYSGLLGTSTNLIGYRHFPSGNFDFHLFDENGRELPKTKAGLDFTGAPRKPTKAELRTRKFFYYTVANKAGEYRRLFRPEDMFVITNKGIYEMEVRIRLCVIMTNGMPDLKAMTDWRNTTSRGIPFAKDFGILTSVPLRVKVVKE
jgi:hypothetical protein